MALTLSRRGFLAGSAGFVLLHPFAARAGAGQAHLRLAATTDLHCHVLPYDYYADRPNDTMGLARTAALVETLRAEAGNVLLFDNGDYLQGNPMGDYMAYRRGLRGDDLHPMIAAMNAMGYDAGTLGNHEFNYGVPFLERANAGAAHPIVCANFAHDLGATPREDRLHHRPYALLDRNLVDGEGVLIPVRVGVIGFVPPQILQWDRAHLEGRYAVRDMLEAARGWVPQMRAEGAQIVVALCHSGIEPGPERPMMENAAFQIAGIEGIDAVVAGHQHLVWPSDDFAGEGLDPATGGMNGKPAVMAGFWGSHLGVIDLLLQREGTDWRIADWQAEARPIYQRAEDRTVTPVVQSFIPAVAASAERHEETLDYVRAEVGRTEAPLHSYFALVADDPSVQIVSQAQLWYVAAQLKGSPHAHLPLLSAAAPFKAGGRGGPDYYTDVPAGPVAIRNVADLYLYPNTVCALRITGAELADWLERSAGQFHRIHPGQGDQTLIDPAFRSYNFDVIDGVSYRIDVTQPSRFDPDGVLIDPRARRILDLRCNGRPVDPAQEFVLATNNYRAGGGGAFPGTGPERMILAAPDTNRDVIVRYLHEVGTVSPRADGNWSFAPAGDATVLFETGPGAVAHLQEVRERGLRIEPAGEGAEGFARFRLWLS